MKRLRRWLFRWCLRHETVSEWVDDVLIPEIRRAHSFKTESTGGANPITGGM